MSGRRLRFDITPRQGVTALAVALGVLLLGLVAYIIWLTQLTGDVVKGGAPQAGIEPVLAIYGPGRGEAPAFSKPMAAAWGGRNRIYVADTQNNRIVIFTDKGRYLGEFGGLGVAKPLDGAKATWTPGKLDYPTDVAVDAATGDVYVADFYNDSISVFSADGEFLRRFPDPGKPVGKGASGAGGLGIAVSAVTVQNGRVYATDTYQVLVFDTKGTLLRQFGMPGTGPGGLDHPNGIAVDSRGRIYVSDSNHNRVTAFTPSGEAIWTAGQPVAGLPQVTSNPFVLPRGLCVLPDGSILLADPLGQRLVKLDTDGQLVAKYGTRGDQPGQLDFPNDVSSRAELVVVSDRENDRVQVVRLTGK